MFIPIDLATAQARHPNEMAALQKKLGGATEAGYSYCTVIGPHTNPLDLSAFGPQTDPRVKEFAEHGPKMGLELKVKNGKRSSSVMIDVDKLAAMGPSGWPLEIYGPSPQSLQAARQNWAVAYLYDDRDVRAPGWQAYQLAGVVRGKMRGKLSPWVASFIRDKEELLIFPDPDGSGLLVSKAELTGAMIASIQGQSPDPAMQGISTRIGKAYPSAIAHRVIYSTFSNAPNLAKGIEWQDAASSEAMQWMQDHAALLDGRMVVKTIGAPTPENTHRWHGVGQELPDMEARMLQNLQTLLQGPRSPGIISGASIVDVLEAKQRHLASLSVTRADLRRICKAVAQGADVITEMSKLDLDPPAPKGPKMR